MTTLEFPVIAKRGDTVFLVRDSKDTVRVANLKANILGPPVPLEVALKWGYWESPLPEDDLTAAVWDESKHPRHERGKAEGGKFRRVHDSVKEGSELGDFDPVRGEYVSMGAVWREEQERAFQEWATNQGISPENAQLIGHQLAPGDTALAKMTVQDRIAARLTGDPDFLALHKYLDEHGDWGSEFGPGGMYPSANTAEKQATALMVGKWAGSSGDGDIFQQQMQVAAQREFNLPGVDTFYGEQVLELTQTFPDQVFTPEQMRGAQKFLRAQYEETQAMFRRHEIDRLPLYRGVGFDNEEGLPPPGIGRSRVRLNPVSSFSWDYDQARKFAIGKPVKMVMGTTVPVSRILSSPFTGYGCLDEAELVVLGGEAEVHRWHWVDPQTYTQVNEEGDLVDVQLPQKGNPLTNQADFDGSWTQAMERQF